MPTYAIVTLCFVALLVALAGLPMLLAAADPEGRGGDLVLPGVACLLGGTGAFIGFGVWVLARLLA